MASGVVRRTCKTFLEFGELRPAAAGESRACSAGPRLRRTLEEQRHEQEQEQGLEQGLWLLHEAPEMEAARSLLSTSRSMTACGSAVTAPTTASCPQEDTCDTVLTDDEQDMRGRCGRLCAGADLGTTRSLQSAASGLGSPNSAAAALIGGWAFDDTRDNVLTDDAQEPLRPLAAPAAVFATTPPPMQAPSAQWQPPSADAARRRAGPAPARPAPTVERTQPHDPLTVMLKNICCRTSPEKLVQLMDAQGFAGQYRSVYVPTRVHGHMRASKRSVTNKGYAFVSFWDAEGVARCIRELDGKDIVFSTAPRRLSVANAFAFATTRRRREFTGLPQAASAGGSTRT